MEKWSLAPGLADVNEMFQLCSRPPVSLSRSGLIFHSFAEIDRTGHSQTTVTGPGQGEEARTVDALAERNAATVDENEPTLIGSDDVAVGPTQPQEIEPHLLQPGRTGLDLGLFSGKNVESQFLPLFLGNAVADASIIRGSRRRFAGSQHRQNGD